MRLQALACALMALVFASPARAEVPVSDGFKTAKTAALDLSNRAQALRQQASDDFSASPARNAEGCKALRDSQALFLQIQPLAERMIAELEYRKADNVETYRGFLISTQYSIDNGDLGIRSCASFDPGWTLSPAVTQMRGLSQLSVAAAQKMLTFKDNPDRSSACPSIEEILSIALAESHLMPAYLAATGSEDTPMTDREAWRDKVSETLKSGASFWYYHCSGKTGPAEHTNWNSADKDFHAELDAFTATATPVTVSMDDPSKYDQVCAPLRTSMAMLALLQRRVVGLKQLAAGDSDHENQARGYYGSIETTVSNLADDAAGCVDGFYARPLFVRNIHAGSDDIHQNYVLIPTYLEQTLEEEDKAREVMHDKVLDAKATWQRHYELGNDLADCGDKSYGKDVAGQEIEIYHRMATEAASYPRLAESFNKAAEQIYDTYSMFWTGCY